MSTLTTANSSLYLTIVGVFNTPVKIQGYATDDAFAISELTNAETFIGVDGKLSAGFTPFIVPLSISLQADSASNAVFDAWIAAESATKDKYEAHIVIMLPATNELYTLSRGFLKSFSAMPAAKKVLQPRKYNIEFQSISVSTA